MAASLSLPPEQQLARPPQLEALRPAEPPAAPSELQPGDKAQVRAAEEELRPPVKELDRQEAELSVCLGVMSLLGGEHVTDGALQ